MRKVVGTGLGIRVALGLVCAVMGGAAMAQNFMPGETDSHSAGILAERKAVLDDLRPVTDAMLRQPPAGAWINWRRSYDGQGYSLLDAIDRENVADLRLAWSWTLASGSTIGTPFVHDGVMFVQHSDDTIEALTAETGDLLWRYSRRLPRGTQGRPKRSMAIYGDKVYAATTDLAVVALDMKTGEPVWEHQLGDMEKGFYLTGGPIAVKGKIIIGMSGCATLETGGCFITALDAETGEPAWRFDTVAAPGTPGGKSWNGIPAERRLGGSVWAPGTYDPELDLLFFGTGQPYPWNAYQRGTSPTVDEPGVTNDALYTNSTLAIDPDTGELVWHYQHLPNDSWDMDYAFERQVIELPVDGEMRKLVVTSGKMAIIEALDAKTGEFVFARDMGLQDLVTAIDPETGEKTIDRSRDPRPGETVTICPHPGGARSWPGVGYNPETGRMFLPLQMHCGEYTPYPREEGDSFGGGGARWRILPPREADGSFGRLEAVDLASRETAWRHADRAPQSTASLPTAGGVVFQGSFDRYFRAHDDRTGEILWQTRLADVPNSFPVTYRAGGRQYVAVMTGAGSPYTRTWGALVPDIRNPGDAGAVVWVFALPE